MASCCIYIYMIMITEVFPDEAMECVMVEDKKFKSDWNEVGEMCWDSGWMIWGEMGRGGTDGWETIWRE